MIDSKYILHFLTLLFSSSTDCQPTASDQSGYSDHLHVRVAQSEDLSSVAEILADSFHSQQGILGWAYPLLRLGIYEDLRNRLRSTAPHHICLVAAVNDKLAGTIEMGLHAAESWASSSHLYLSNLAVHPTVRRQGVAGQLLISCERVALSWGFHELYLHVLENNQQARQLYFKLGYRLYKVDSHWSAWLLRRPRQMLLHKDLSRETINPTASQS